MTSQIENSVTSDPQAIGLPPLEAGDRLTRDEFERRYQAMPQAKRAELIEGVVYMTSPVRMERHGRPHGHVITLLGAYEAYTPGVLMADNASDRLDLDNEPQPDGALLIDPEFGGQARISEDDYLEGAPELVAEISSSSVSYDLGDKLHAYRRNGVREYVVWRVLDRAIDWFILRGGAYEKLLRDEQGLIKSEVFPGLWLDSEALLSGNVAQALDVMRQGTTSDEHARFVASLQARHP